MSIPIGRRRHLVTLENPGVVVPDNEGGYTTVSAPLSPPSLYVAIEPASVRQMERLFASTIVASASHVVTGPFHPGITLQTVIKFDGRTLQIKGIQNVDERNVELVMACEEVVH